MAAYSKGSKREPLLDAPPTQFMRSARKLLADASVGEGRPIVFQWFAFGTGDSGALRSAIQPVLSGGYFRGPPENRLFLALDDFTQSPLRTVCCLRCTPVIPYAGVDCIFRLSLGNPSKNRVRMRCNRISTYET